MKSCYPKRAPNLAFREFDGEVIVMNPENSWLYNLNGTASAIWRGADGRTSLEEIVAREIVPEFEVDPAEALRDADEFAKSLAAQSIILLLPQAEAEA